MQIKTLNVGLFQTNCYLVSDEKYVMVIDPGDHYSYIVSELPGEVTHIVITHYHPDHIGALKELKESFPKALVITGKNEITTTEFVVDVAKQALGPWFPRTQFSKPGFSAVQPDLTVGEKDSVCGFEVLETPGHTPGSICLLNKKEGCIFTGDTLFQGSFGRTDFTGGDYDSIMFSVKKLMALDNNIRVYPGHNEFTTIGNEKSVYQCFSL